MPVPERVAGIDFILALWRSAARNGYRVYLLGAEAAVVEAGDGAYRHLQGVEVVGHRDGYWDERKEPQVVAGVREARPDILFLAMPSPRKEYFLAAAEGAGLCPGGRCRRIFRRGGGLRSRAPRWMQRTGLEWFHRMAQEPRRMFLRYAVGNTRFVALTAVHGAAANRPQPRRVGPTARTGIGRRRARPSRRGMLGGAARETTRRAAARRPLQGQGEGRDRDPPRTPRNSGARPDEAVRLMPCRMKPV